MIKILFVCHGNICRSPISQYVFQKLINDKGLESFFEIDSAATSSEEIGNPVYPPAIRTLKAHGITDITHRARRITENDYKHFNLIEVMDSYNYRNAVRMTGNDPEIKIEMLLKNDIIDDPWYTGDFAGVYKQIEMGCSLLLNRILSYKGFSLESTTDWKVFELYTHLFDTWNRSTCTPRMQSRWTSLNRTTGQCSVTSFLIQDYLGGDVYGTPLNDTSVHCFNIINRKIYDLTSAQFDNSETKVNYDNATLQDRNTHFEKEEKYRRYLKLSENIKTRLVQNPLNMI